MNPAVLAIDAGNSKTDAILVQADGEVLASVRVGGFRPQIDGQPAAMAVLDEAVAALRQLLGRPAGRPIAGHVSACLAGVDLPEEEDALGRAVVDRGWATTSWVGNDTLALLRAGTHAGHGVAVVCGSGINCVGVGPDGRTARFPALGRLTGDWGGGHFLGEETLWWAVRAEDGRGPATALAQAVAAHFTLPTAHDVALAVHFGRLPNGRLGELCPILLAAALGGDPVACGVVERLAEEVTLLATTALRRLDRLDLTTDVVLGGGVLTGSDLLPGMVRRRIADRTPHARVLVVDHPPVVGAALLGLDRLAGTGRTPAAVATRLGARVGSPQRAVS